MSVTSDELNYLIWRYLQESGHELSTFALQKETRAHLLDSQFSKHISIGALVSIVQKGIQYMEVEALIRENGEISTEEKPFTLFGALHIDDQEPKNLDNTNGLISNNTSEPKESKIEAQDRSKLKNNENKPENDDKMDVDGDTNPDIISKPQDNNNIPKKTKQTPSVTLKEDSTETSQESMVNKTTTQDVSIQAQTITLPRPIRELECIYETEASECSQWSPASPSTLVISNTTDSATLYSFPNFYSDNNPDSSSKIVPLRSQKLTHSAIDFSEDKNVTAIAWNSVGTSFATATFDGHMKLWSSEGTLRHKLIFHRSPVLVIKWNQPNTLLLSVDCTNTVAVWDAYSGEIKQSFQHPPGVYDLSNGYTNGNEGKSLTTNTTLTTPNMTIGTDADWIDPLTYATTSDNATIMIYKISERNPMFKFRGHDQGINSLQFEPNYKLLVSASDDHTIKLWHGKSQNPCMTLVGHQSSVITAKWLPTTNVLSALDPVSFGGGRIVSASLDGTVRVWDHSTGVCLSVLSLHEGPIFACEVSPNGKFVASGGLDGVLIIWDVSTITTIERSAVLAVQEPDKRLTDISGAIHAVARFELKSSSNDKTSTSTVQAENKPSNTENIENFEDEKDKSLVEKSSIDTAKADKQIKKEHNSAENTEPQHINWISWSRDSAKVCVSFSSKTTIIDVSPLLPNSH